MVAMAIAGSLGSDALVSSKPSLTSRQTGFGGFMIVGTHCAAADFES